MSLLRNSRIKLTAVSVVASTLTPSHKTRDPTNIRTPGLGDFATEPMSPTRRTAFAGRAARPSDTWEVLSESNASIISADKRDNGTSGSMSSWKSAGNGERLSEFGGELESSPAFIPSADALGQRTALAHRDLNHLDPPPSRHLRI